MARFALQNGPFEVAERAVLQCETARIGGRKKVCRIGLWRCVQLPCNGFMAQNNANRPA